MTLSEISFGQRVPLAFIANFSFGKVVLRAETRFAIIELCQKKSKNWSFLVSCELLEVIFGTQKMAKALNKILCKFRKVQRSRFVILLHIYSPEVSEIGKSFHNFGVNFRNFSNMNIEMSLQNYTYWTRSLAVFECLDHSYPRSSPKNVPLEGVIHI